MQKEITIKDFHRIGLEVQSHLGLPYQKCGYYIHAFLMIRSLWVHDIDSANIVSNIMIFYHNKRRKSINKHLRSYDW